MSKKGEVVKGTVEKVCPVELDVFAGFTDDECINKIKNATMKKQVRLFKNAVVSETQNRWKQAMAIAGMTEKARAEFGNDKNVAQFLGMTKAMFSKMQRAGLVALEAKERGIVDLPSCNAVIELLPVSNEKHGKQDILKCAEHVLENQMDINEIRDYVKSFEIPGEKTEDERKETKQEKKQEKKQEEKYENEELMTLVTVIGSGVNTIQSLTKNCKMELIESIYNVLAEFGITSDDIHVTF